jgi:hypothetical protein
MAEFSVAEKSLLQSIPPSSRLRTSLSLLREASQDIWLTGGPRIIQDYTDHGIPHSERIAGYAAKLLKSGRTRLSEEEMYLLLAGIYLHDIGMQCDVVRHPEIKALAETEYGAQFNIEFTAQRSNDYSVEEQKAIRKNHHYLSIAWIAYAKHTGKTVLGSAAQTIPNHLVRDLTDVCKHHTSLPIDACDEMFERGQSERKRLVAALLRFADELDIAANRISIETVQNFNLDPSNTVYWWLHNRTHITFPKKNLVKVEVWMHPNDTIQYGKSIKSAFIDKFRQKNASVMRVLAEKDIFIQIHDKSDVKSSDNEDLFPPEIGEALRAMSGQQGNSFPPGKQDSKQDYTTTLPVPPPTPASPTDTAGKDKSVNAGLEAEHANTFTDRTSNSRLPSLPALIEQIRKQRSSLEYIQQLLKPANPSDEHAQRALGLLDKLHEPVLEAIKLLNPACDHDQEAGSGEAAVATRNRPGDASALLIELYAIDQGIKDIKKNRSRSQNLVPQLIRTLKNLPTSNLV